MNGNRFSFNGFYEYECSMINSECRPWVILEITVMRLLFKRTFDFEGEM